jgi:hypothetical protein
VSPEEGVQKVVKTDITKPGRTRPPPPPTPLRFIDVSPTSRAQLAPSSSLLSWTHLCTPCLIQRGALPLVNRSSAMERPTSQMSSESIVAPVNVVDAQIPSSTVETTEVSAAAPLPKSSKAGEMFGCERCDKKFQREYSRDVHSRRCSSRAQAQ